MLALRWLSLLAAGALLLTASASLADGPDDRPVAGRTLRMSGVGRPIGRLLVMRSELDPAVAAPFRDPRAEGASLFVFSSNAVGECRAEIPLPAEHWEPIGRDGAARGWRYRDRAAGSGGVRWVLVRGDTSRGRIAVQARGANFPCDLREAAAAPVHVQISLGDTRYCAAFGGDIRRRGEGRFNARRAPAPADCVGDDVTGATLNLLHGLFCPAPSAGCRRTDRIDLLGAWIAERGCPDWIALQEITQTAAIDMPAEIAAIADVCPVPYAIHYIPGNSVDDSLLMTRHAILSSQVLELWGGFRNVLITEIDHPVGPVWVFSTHLASGADGGGQPCSFFGACPSDCLAAGAVTVRDCQAVQLGQIVAAHHDGARPALVMGDFNSPPGSFVYDHLRALGWIDASLAAGVAECDASSGTGCTSGREDTDLSDMESPALGLDERIDYAFVVPAAPASTCSGTLDGAQDGDGDGIATRLFADEPNPFAPSCGPAPLPMCWPSDHSGVQLDLGCQ